MVFNFPEPFQARTPLTWTLLYSNHRSFWIIRSLLALAPAGLVAVLIGGGSEALVGIAVISTFPVWSVLTMGAAMDNVAEIAPLTHGTQLERWKPKFGAAIASFWFINFMGNLCLLFTTAATGLPPDLVVFTTLSLLFWVWWFICAQLVIEDEDANIAISRGVNEAMSTLRSFLPCGTDASPDSGLASSLQSLRKSGLRITFAPIFWLIFGAVLSLPVVIGLEALSESLGGPGTTIYPLDILLMCTFSFVCGSRAFHLSAIRWTLDAMAQSSLRSLPGSGSDGSNQEDNEAPPTIKVLDRRRDQIS